jgi:hypothetical protein
MPDLMESDEIGPELRELLDSIFRIIEALYFEQCCYIALLNEHAPDSLSNLAYLARNAAHQRAVHEKFQALFNRTLSIPELRETVERLVRTPLESPPKPN